jgi:hypothetical protein
MTKKKNVVVKAATDQVKVGVVSMAGMGAVGAIAPLVPHSSSVVGVVGSGLALTNIGQMLKGGKEIGQTLMPQKKKTGNKYIDRII